MNGILWVPLIFGCACGSLGFPSGYTPLSEARTKELVEPYKSFIENLSYTPGSMNVADFQLFLEAVKDHETSFLPFYDLVMAMADDVIPLLLAEPNVVRVRSYSPDEVDIELHRSDSKSVQVESAHMKQSSESEAAPNSGLFGGQGPSTGQGGNGLGGKKREVFPPGVTVVGDIHGQIYDFVSVWDISGFPSKENKFVFNGDFVDRGANSMGVLAALMYAKLLWPNYVFLLRGNHESAAMNLAYGFDTEVEDRLDGRDGVRTMAFKAKMQEVFSALPIAAVIDESIFVCHGSIPIRQKKLHTPPFPVSDEVRMWLKSQQEQEGSSSQGSSTWHDAPSEEHMDSTSECSGTDKSNESGLSSSSFKTALEEAQEDANFLEASTGLDKENVAPVSKAGQDLKPGQESTLGEDFASHGLHRSNSLVNKLTEPDAHPVHLETYDSVVLDLAEIDRIPRAKYVFEMLDDYLVSKDFESDVDAYWQAYLDSLSKVGPGNEDPLADTKKESTDMVQGSTDKMGESATQGESVSAGGSVNAGDSANAGGSSVLREIPTAVTAATEGLLGTVQPSAPPMPTGSGFDFMASSSAEEYDSQTDDYIMGWNLDAEGSQGQQEQGQGQNGDNGLAMGAASEATRRARAELMVSISSELSKYPSKEHLKFKLWTDMMLLDVMAMLLWGDPEEGFGLKPSPRGSAFTIGEDVTQAFLTKNQLNLVVRSHQVAEGGYFWNHAGRTLTVFSASSYCGTMFNSAAIARFTRLPEETADKIAEIVRVALDDAMNQSETHDTPAPNQLETNQPGQNNHSGRIDAQDSHPLANPSHPLANPSQEPSSRSSSRSRGRSAEVVQMLGRQIDEFNRIIMFQRIFGTTSIVGMTHFLDLFTWQSKFAARYPSLPYSFSELRESHVLEYVQRVLDRVRSSAEHGAFINQFSEEIFAEPEEVHDYDNEDPYAEMVDTRGLHLPKQATAGPRGVPATTKTGPITAKSGPATALSVLTAGKTLLIEIDKNGNERQVEDNLKKSANKSGSVVKGSAFGSDKKTVSSKGVSLGRRGSFQEPAWATKFVPGLAAPGLDLTAATESSPEGLGSSSEGLGSPTTGNRQRSLGSIGKGGFVMSKGGTVSIVFSDVEFPPSDDDGEGSEDEESARNRWKTREQRIKDRKAREARIARGNETTGRDHRGYGTIKRTPVDGKKSGDSRTSSGDSRTGSGDSKASFGGSEDTSSDSAWINGMRRYGGVVSALTEGLRKAGAGVATVFGGTGKSHSGKTPSGKSPSEKSPSQGDREAHHQDSNQAYHQDSNQAHHQESNQAHHQESSRNRREEWLKSGHDSDDDEDRVGTGIGFGIRPCQGFTGGKVKGKLKTEGTVPLVEMKHVVPSTKAVVSEGHSKPEGSPHSVPQGWSHSGSHGQIIYPIGHGPLGQVPTGQLVAHSGQEDNDDGENGFDSMLMKRKHDMARHGERDRQPFSPNTQPFASNAQPLASNNPFDQFLTLEYMKHSLSQEELARRSHLGLGSLGASDAEHDAYGSNEHGAYGSNERYSSGSNERDAESNETTPEDDEDGLVYGDPSLLSKEALEKALASNGGLGPYFLDTENEVPSRPNSPPKDAQGRINYLMSIATSVTPGELARALESEPNE